MIEAPIEEWVCDQAEKAGWLCRKLKWIGRRSAMDRFFAKDSRIVFMEFKRPGKTKGDRTQPAEIERMQAAGVEVHIVDNPLVALRILGVSYEAV